jgi:hypothetical protein
MAKSAFFSFHYERDSWRVQQIRNIGALDEQPILTAQKWEEVKNSGPKAIENWIADQMSRKSAVVVLVGAQTASRKWVRYEITKAWNDKRPLVGVRIHGLQDRDGNVDSAGENPFSNITLQDGRTVADYVTLHDPQGWNSQQIYRSIKQNLLSWTENAYRRT